MIRVGDVLVECARGDIAAQPDVDAVVCAANPWLTTGAGVAGALHRAAGPALYREAAPHAPLATGKAVMTGAHGLPNRHVIHTVGPVYGQDRPSDRLLASCFRSCLELADEAALESVAFPAISTGVYGYPLGEAAQVSVDAVVEVAPRLASVRRVRFVLWAASDLAVYAEALERAARAS